MKELTYLFLLSLFPFQINSFVLVYSQFPSIFWCYDQSCNIRPSPTEECPTERTNRVEIFSVFCWAKPWPGLGQCLPEKKNDFLIFTKVPYGLAIALLMSSVGSGARNKSTGARFAEFTEFTEQDMQQRYIWWRKWYLSCYVISHLCKWLLYSPFFSFFIFFKLSKANCGEAKRKPVGEGSHSESFGESPWSHSLVVLVEGVPLPGSLCSECLQESMFRKSRVLGSELIFNLLKDISIPLLIEHDLLTENQKWQASEATASRGEAVEWVNQWTTPSTIERPRTPFLVLQGWAVSLINRRKVSGMI